MTADPLAFLHATLDVVQKRAEAAGERAWSPHWEYDHMAHEVRDLNNGNTLATIYFDEIGNHVEATSPAAVLRLVAGHRKLTEAHTTPHTVVDDFCVEEGGPCTHRGEDECAICGQRPCDTVRFLAEGWGWTEETA